MRNRLGYALAHAIFLTLGGVSTSIALGGEPKPFPGKSSLWNGFERRDFEVDGRSAIVVSPKKALPGRPWAWRGEFFGAFPNADVALLEKGWHLAYLSVPNQFGSPKAMKAWERFHRVLVDEHGLARRPALIGLSRGALYCMAWASLHPDDTLLVYLDNGVCDFKSWPGGKPKGLGKGAGSEVEWKRLLDAFDFPDDRAAIAYRGNPVDRLEEIARARIPILLVYGDADRTVPHDENSALLFDRYRALGGPVERIVKPGVDHHPHGLADPAPIVAYFEKIRSSSNPE
ncbi:MAG: alpha/beta hydrolase [Isosphaeraceae bacterium]|nr:alpha/beta hydrolase [Isosphaeraceae bacterium]